MKIKKRMKNLLIVAIIISFIIIVINFLIYNYYLSLFKSISASASNTGSLSFSVEGDTISPLISITDPENTTYTSHRTKLDYTVSDDASLNSCWYSLDNGVTNTTITCGNNVSGITSSAGSNTWIVYANDTSGNRNSSSVTFSVSIPASPAPAAAAAGGGGGGAAGIAATKEFDVTPTELNLFLIPGEETDREIKVVNREKSSLIINIEITGINDIVKLNTNQLVLSPGAEQRVLLTVKAPESGIYAGRIIFKSGETRKEVFVLVNVRSEKKLFDVSITLPESYKTIYRGQDLNAFISLLQIGPPIGTDITIAYLIKDFNGNTISKESETLFVYEAKSFVKEFPASNLKIGDYIAGIEVTYPGGFATSSTHFRIIEKRVDFQFIVIIIIAILAIIIIIYSILRYKKADKYIHLRKK